MQRTYPPTRTLYPTLSSQLPSLSHSTADARDVRCLGTRAKVARTSSAAACVREPPFPPPRPCAAA
eukprot:1372727-Pleurochrysis_carterae.AAC.1